jgi:hypothetical protein
MSLRFPYRRFRVKQPLLTLGGRRERPRPVIGVTVIGPADSRYIHGLLDSGSDDTIFPETLAVKLGIDLTNAPVMDAAGVGMITYAVRLAEVTLRLADKSERRKWQAWVGFTAAQLRQPLLGHAGFLQFFTTAFHGDLEEVELTINAGYSGIQ